MASAGVGGSVTADGSKKLIEKDFLSQKYLLFVSIFMRTGAVISTLLSKEQTPTNDLPICKVYIYVQAKSKKCSVFALLFNQLFKKTSESRLRLIVPLMYLNSLLNAVIVAKSMKKADSSVVIHFAES